MANPGGSMDGWVAEQQEEGRASYHCRQDEGLLTTGLAACPKTRNNLWSQRPPQSRSQLQPYDFERHIIMVSSARIPIADKHCSVALYWYRLTIQEGIARRNMKMRKSTQTGVLAKSGVLTGKDKIAQNHILAIKCTNN